MTWNSSLRPSESDDEQLWRDALSVVRSAVDTGVSADPTPVVAQVRRLTHGSDRRHKAQLTAHVALVTAWILSNLEAETSSAVLELLDAVLHNPDATLAWMVQQLDAALAAGLAQACEPTTPAAS